MGVAEAAPRVGHIYVIEGRETGRWGAGLTTRILCGGEVRVSRPGVPGDWMTTDRKQATCAACLAAPEPPLRLELVEREG